MSLFEGNQPMKTCTIGLTLCGLLSAATGQAQTPQVTAAQWNKSATVKNGVLTYEWITPKPHLGLLVHQSMASYDSHMAKTILTPAQLTWVRQWEQQYQVFSLPRHYPKPRRVSYYGKGYTRSLSIQQKNHFLTSTWYEMDDHAARANAACSAFFTWAEHQTMGH